MPGRCRTIHRRHGRGSLPEEASRVPGVKDLLAFVPLYVALQRGLGADRLRYRCIEELALQPGERVLDVGCGPAYYFERLPQGVRYFGFDTSARYVEHARRRFGGDNAARQLLHLAGQVLAPGGRVISVDSCFEPSQGRLSRWMSENDRGEYVRTPEQFVALAEESFGDVDGQVVSDATRMPSSFWMMRMRSPVVAPAG